jgi:alkylation response protein AidB-like acyl-CoA dehydrogenase
VIDGHNADLLLVVTNGEKGMSVFAIEKDTAGVSCETRLIVDSQRAADISLEAVAVTKEALLGSLGDASSALEFTIDVAAACSAAEMLGISIETFERTVGYLKEREQFGNKIGTFQGLQHRAAQLFAEIEVSKSAVLAALQALDENSEKRSVLASMAKAKCAKVVRNATEEGVQMHGGIGMTDEFDIGFFMKRAAVCRQAYGDYHFHANRFAELRGY